MSQQGHCTRREFGSLHVGFGVLRPGGCVHRQRFSDATSEPRSVGSSSHASSANSTTKLMSELHLTDWRHMVDTKRTGGRNTPSLGPCTIEEL